MPAETDLHLGAARLTLRLRQRVRGFRDHGALAAVVRGTVAQLQQATHLDVRWRGDEPVAVFALSPAPTSWFGVPVTHAVLLGDADQSPWLLDAARAAPLPADTVTEALPHQRWLARRLPTVGLHPEAVVLAGTPDSAALGLGRGPAEAAFRDVGLGVRPARPDDATPIVHLLRDLFTAQPEHGWFLANPGWLDAFHDDLTAHPAGHVVTWDDRVVGALQLTVEEAPFWGRCAGLGLYLAPELQGRGLAAPGYRMLLRDALAQGAHLVKGGTSQPGVMRLSARMGRWPVAWSFTTTPTFGWDHWGPFAP